MTTKHIASHVERTEEVYPDLEAALNGLNAKAASEIRAAHRDHNNTAENNHDAMWRTGERANRLGQDDYRRPAVRGGKPMNPVKILAQVLGYSEGYLEAMRKFYRSLPTREELEAYKALRTAKGGKALTWAQTLKLQQVYAEGSDNKVYFMLRDEALANDWDANMIDIRIEKLAQHATKKSPGYRRAVEHRGGRPISVPVNFEGRGARFYKQASIMVRHTNDVYVHSVNGLMAALRKLPTSKVAAKASEYGELCHKGREQLDNLRLALDKMEAEFKEVEEYLTVCSREKEKADSDRDVKTLRGK